MSFAAAVWTFGGILFLVGVCLIVRDVRRRGRHPVKRGAEPGQGATLVSSSSGTGRGDYVSVITVPKAPQEYARAMSPRK